MSGLSARELVDQLLHRGEWHTPDKIDILAARVEKVLALPQLSSKDVASGTSPLGAIGYNNALELVRRILNGEGE